MQIRAEDGTVVLPNGRVIEPGLTQADFLTGAAGEGAVSQDYGTRPFIHHRIEAGQIDGHEVIASACYYGEMILYLDVTVDLYPPGPKDWSNYSLEVEAATKDFHDALLEGMLGPPAKVHDFSGGEKNKKLKTLSQPKEWKFPWGSVWSGHDGKGGGTSFVVRFGDRLEMANRDYGRRHSGL